MPVRINRRLLRSLVLVHSRILICSSGSPGISTGSGRRIGFICRLRRLLLISKEHEIISPTDADPEDGWLL